MRIVKGLGKNAHPIFSIFLEQVIEEGGQLLTARLWEEVGGYHVLQVPQIRFSLNFTTSMS